MKILQVKTGENDSTACWYTGTDAGIAEEKALWKRNNPEGGIFFNEWDNDAFPFMTVADLPPCMPLRILGKILKEIENHG
jgi:hypothetical protein